MTATETVLRISTTALDQYRRFRLYDYVSFDEVVASLKRQGETSFQMIVGTAFGELVIPSTRFDAVPVEGSEEFTVERNGIVFDARSICDARDKMPALGVYEAKRTKRFNIGGRSVLLVAQADALYGRTVYENKTTWKACDVEGYMESPQWACYLEVFGADRCIYNVWRLKDRGVIEVDEHTQFTVTRYAGMTDTVRNYLSEYVTFLDDNNLTEYVERTDTSEDYAL